MNTVIEGDLVRGRLDATALDVTEAVAVQMGDGESEQAAVVVGAQPFDHALLDAGRIGVALDPIEPHGGAAGESLQVVGERLQGPAHGVGDQETAAANDAELVGIEQGTVEIDRFDLQKMGPGVRHAGSDILGMNALVQA